MRTMPCMNNMIFNIYSGCNVRCRHCSNEEMLSTSQVMDEKIIEKALKEGKEAGLKQITFVGGEPFLAYSSLQKYCCLAKENGVNACAITNGYWAKSKEAALETLTALPGLTSLFLSTDFYHLEFISYSIIENALWACFELGIKVSLNATCAKKEDRKLLRNLFQQYKNKVYLNVQMLMPIGAAKKIEIERFVLKEKIDRLGHVCGIGNYYVDMNGDVYGCCNSLLLEKRMFYYGNLREMSLSQIQKEASRDSLYQYICKKGPRGIGKLLKQSDLYEEYQEEKYTCECDFCISVMKHNFKLYKTLEEDGGAKW